MFVRDVNGFILNLRFINKINIEFNETMCKVVAHIGNGCYQVLFKSNELQLCQEYLNELSRKIAVNVDVWN